MVVFRRHAIFFVTALALLVAPAGAHSLTYCLNDAACVSGGGSAQPTLAAAVSAADANVGADTIRIGSSIVQVPVAASISSSATEQLTIVGAGSANTTLLLPSAGTGLQMRGPSPSLSGVTLITQATTEFGLIMNPASGVFSVNDVRITSDTIGRWGAELRGAGTATQIQLQLPVTSAVYNRGIDVISGSGSTVRIQDSDIQAPIAIAEYGAGTLDVRRSTIVGGANGITVQPVMGTGNGGHLDLSSSVVRMVTDPGYGQQTAVRLQASAGVGLPVTRTATVQNTTIIADSAVGTTRAIYTQADPNAGTAASTSINVDGVIAAGPFDFTFIANTAMPATATISPIRSNFDPALNQPQGTGNITSNASNTNVAPGFLNAPAHDYRLGWNSPLLDLGPSSLAPGASPTDRLSAPRAVAKTSSSAAVGASDMGAFEYQRKAPVVVLAQPAGVLTNAAVNITASATDPNPEENASLTYLWTLPGGGTSTTASASFMAPSTAGSYPVQVTVTDLTGLATTVVVQLVVSAPIIDDTTTPTLDTTAPVVTFGLQRLSLSKLVRRKAYVTRFRMGEAATMRASLQVTVRRKRVGKPGYVTTKLVLGTTTKKFAGGSSLLAINMIRARHASWSKLRRTPGVKLTYAIVGTATDTAKNVRRFSVPMKLVR